MYVRHKFVHSEGSEEFAHTHSLARAFTACLLNAMYLMPANKTITCTNTGFFYYYLTELYFF